MAGRVCMGKAAGVVSFWRMSINGFSWSYVIYSNSMNDSALSFLSFNAISTNGSARNDSECTLIK